MLESRRSTTTNILIIIIKHPHNSLSRVADEDDDDDGAGGGADDDDVGCTFVMTAVYIGSDAYNGDRDDDYCTMYYSQFDLEYHMNQVLCPMLR